MVLRKLSGKRWVMITDWQRTVMAGLMYFLCFIKSTLDLVSFVCNFSLEWNQVARKGEIWKRNNLIVWLLEVGQQGREHKRQKEDFFFRVFMTSKRRARLNTSDHWNAKEHLHSGEHKQVLIHGLARRGVCLELQPRALCLREAH